MKRIITCSDGTWNKPNAMHKNMPIRTNVQKFFDYILGGDDKGVTQIKYYDAGIGAAGGWITRMFQGATGKGIDENILDCYKFIVWNFEHGKSFEDELYLLGFSRGAYTARSLAGLIRKCGIIKKNDLNLIDAAYKLYRNKKLAPDDNEMVQFRKMNSHDISCIKFIGVWDTVGSLGIPLNTFQKFNEKKYSFYDTTLSSIVEHAYHAVSLDERRGNFKPALWQRSKHSGERSFEQKLEQRWFAGVHSNVGGGYPDEGLSDISLRWMITKALDAGLSLDLERIQADVKENIRGTLYNSQSGIFSLLPGYTRVIEEGVVDPSVHERMQYLAEYKPANIPPTNPGETLVT